MDCKAYMAETYYLCLLSILCSVNVNIMYCRALVSFQFMAKYNCYVVWVGRRPGIYYTWPDCYDQVNGYPGAKYKGFTSVEVGHHAYREFFRYGVTPAPSHAHYGPPVRGTVAEALRTYPPAPAPTNMGPERHANQNDAVIKTMMFIIVLLIVLVLALLLHL